VFQDYRGVVDKGFSGKLGPIESINVNVGPLSQPCNGHDFRPRIIQEQHS
jgi:hypothetical protein